MSHGHLAEPLILNFSGVRRELADDRAVLLTSVYASTVVTHRKIANKRLKASGTRGRSAP